jgi:hypothetical protein
MFPLGSAGGSSAASHMSGSDLSGFGMVTFIEYQNEREKMVCFIRDESWQELWKGLESVAWVSIMSTVTHLYIRNGSITEIINLSTNCNM